MIINEMPMFSNLAPCTTSMKSYGLGYEDPLAAFRRSVGLDEQKPAGARSGAAAVSPLSGFGAAVDWFSQTVEKARSWGDSSCGAQFPPSYNSHIDIFLRCFRS